MFVNEYPIRRYKNKKPEQKWGKTILFFILAISALIYLMLSCRTSKKEYENHGQFILNSPSFVIPDSLITTTGTLSLSLDSLGKGNVLVDSLGNGELATGFLVKHDTTLGDVPLLPKIKGYDN